MNCAQSYQKKVNQNSKKHTDILHQDPKINQKHCYAQGIDDFRLIYVENHLVLILCRKLSEET